MGSNGWFRFCVAAWRAGLLRHNSISTRRAHGYFSKSPAFYSARLRSLSIYVKDIVAFGDIECSGNSAGCSRCPSWRQNNFHILIFENGILLVLLFAGLLLSSALAALS